MKAIILAGGKGTRLLPLTKNLPKALVKTGKQTLIEKVLQQLPEEIDTVIITTKYLGKLIEKEIGNSYSGKRVLYATQPENMDGTWPALYCTKGYMESDEHFLVVNCDDFFNKEELLNILGKRKVGMGISKKKMPASYYGIRIAQNGYIENFEKHEGLTRNDMVEDWFGNGLYILNSKVFEFDPVQIGGGEYGLPQTLLKYKETYPLFAHKISFWQPCNSFEDLEKVKNL